MTRILESVRAARDGAARRGRSVAVRDCAVAELALGSGLRVSELAGLACSDLALTDFAAVMVRRGKGGRSRAVRISTELRVSCSRFLEWKRARGESVEPDAPVFLSSSSGTGLSARALQQSWTRSLRRAGVRHVGIHAARHTYATHLLKASGGNVRLVQRQLGHASLATTQIYLGLFVGEVEAAVEGLYRTP